MIIQRILSSKPNKILINTIKSIRNGTRMSIGNKTMDMKLHESIEKPIYENIILIQSSTLNTDKTDEKEKSKPIVGYWLLFNSVMVFSIIIIGGLTRLTESGLSITEWNLIKGIQLPTTITDWENEFSKYKRYPQYQM